jgi:hypothetical protein
VEPLFLDLQSENYQPISQALRVSNRGVGTLEGTVEALVPWLHCTPARFSCETGVSAQIAVDALLEKLREGTYSAASAIRVESNGGSETVEAVMRVVLRPEMSLSVEGLDMRDASRTSFELANTGEGTLHAQVIPLQEWIVVSRRDWTIKGGKHANVRVSLVEAPPASHGEIEVRGADQTIRLTVQT